MRARMLVVSTAAGESGGRPGDAILVDDFRVRDPSLWRCVGDDPGCPPRRRAEVLGHHVLADSGRDLDRSRSGQQRHVRRQLQRLSELRDEHTSRRRAACSDGVAEPDEQFRQSSARTKASTFQSSCAMTWTSLMSTSCRRDECRARRPCSCGPPARIAAIDGAARRKGEDTLGAKRRRMPWVAKIKREDPFRPEDSNELYAQCKRICKRH
jgi:hypothetical protein